MPLPRTRRVLAAAAALALAACSRPTPDAAKASPPPPPGPDAVVSGLYRDHFANQQNWTETYRRRRADFTPALAKLLDDDDRASAANADEIVGLDFDPLTYAQDVMTGYEVAPPSRNGDTTFVVVTLRQDTARVPVRVEMAQTGTAWRVANLRYPEGDLVSLLQQLASDRAKSK